MTYGLYVVVDGKRCTQYLHQGDNFIEGRKGKTYELELHNPTGFDAEFVVSIDGLSIVDGKPAGAKSPGYIVRKFQTMRIKGWLVDSSTAAEFKFGEKKDSYTAVSPQGSVENAGVIGLQVFTQKIDPYTYFHDLNDIKFMNDIKFGDAIPQNNSGFSPASRGFGTLSSSGATASSGRWSERAMNAIPKGIAPKTTTMSASLGTEFGKATQFATTKVNFERASETPAQTTVIYYGDQNDLNKLGIKLDWQQSKLESRPNPFPNDYCAPPVNWRND